MADIIGNALQDYQNGLYTEDIVTWTNISGKDVLPISYLFRDYKKMPKIEQKALKLAKGKVLDVGCGSGSHSLYLQAQGVNIKAIDASQGAIKVAEERGVLYVECIKILDLEDKFDTILILMNGTGIFEELKSVAQYLKHLKRLLKSNGQILIDSSDIAYMYQDEDGGQWVDATAGYYGELQYFMSYKGETEELKWLYLDFETLSTACQSVGLKCELVCEGEHFDYLAKIVSL